MYRMLIVDDMPIIVDDLADMFKELEYFELAVYKAYSTQESLQILGEQKIDIVLSDIKMPGMNGLELLKEIRVRWPHSKVIFLTSYHDFQYAKEAISLGSFDYILKTEGDSKIISSVEKAIQEIREDSKVTDLIEKSQIKFRQAKPFMKSDMLLNIIFGRFHSHQERAKQFASVDMPFSSNAPVYLIISRPDKWKEDLDFSNRNLLNYAVQNIFEEYVSSKFQIHCTAYDRTNVVWFLQPYSPEKLTDRDWERSFRFLFGTLETVQNTCRELLELQVSFLISASPVAWEEIPSAFHQLDLLFHSGIALNTEILMTNEQMLLSSKELENQQTGAFSEQHQSRYMTYSRMNELLKSGKKEEFLFTLDELMQSEGGDRGNHAQKLEIYHMLAALYMSCLNSRDVSFSSLESNDFKWLTAFDADETWSNCKNYFRNVFIKWFEYKSKEQEENSNKIILDLQEYIRTNLQGDLSLTRLGEYVNLNPSYLSRLYKQMTGESLTEYITGVRIQMAKDLLLGNTKIQDIAEAIGYYSGTAFARFFKKQMNITPQDYRESRER